MDLDKSGLGSLSRLLSLWWSDRLIRFLVLLFIPTAFLDGIYTSWNIAKHGLLGELNPLIRWLFQRGLGNYWVFIDVLGSFLCAALLGSYFIGSTDKAKTWMATVFSAIFTLRIGIDCYHIIHYYAYHGFYQTMLLIGASSFILTEGSLLFGDEVKRSLLSILNDIGTALILTDQVSLSRKLFEEPRRTLLKLGKLRARVKPSLTRIKAVKILLLLLALVLVPVASLSLIQFIANCMGVEALPKWLKALGIVEQVQGQFFLIGFAVILAMLAVLIYIILSMLDVISAP
jgi:hypothetical protein